jgi:spore germination cell wall hydrolase CwlJ-like protein
VVACVLKNKWERFCYDFYINRKVVPERIGYRFPRERILSRISGLVIVVAIVSANAAVGTNQIGRDVSSLDEASVTQPYHPANWLTGVVTTKGSKSAVMGAFNYATESKYEFAATASDVDRLVASGALVPLEGKYIRLKNVSYPFVQPVVARFVNRLGEQYAARGCGKLVANSGVRPLDFQGTLANGSSHSVHPTGMAVDLERIVPKTVKEEFCLQWLKDTLVKIESTKRVDMTAEKNPRHYHVVVVPHVYETWMARQPSGLDSDVKWLATALYFEADFNESMEGYRAIGWAILNRVRSSEFPDTIVEVVAEGAAGRSAGGCQFSFMCDGKAEHIQTLCARPNTVMTQFWLGKCDERWEVVVNIAKQILSEKSDPTGGAVSYYAASMDTPPYWAKSDMRSGTIRKIGSHIFACSNFRGSDVCAATSKGGES